jgi:hypothetical protein
MAELKVVPATVTGSAQWATREPVGVSFDPDDDRTNQ